MPIVRLIDPSPVRHDFVCMALAMFNNALSETQSWADGQFTIEIRIMLFTCGSTFSASMGSCDAMDRMR